MLEKISKHDLIFFVVLVIVANLLRIIGQEYVFLFLGAGFILFGNFIILEREDFPYMKNRPRLAIGLGWLSVCVGGLIWKLYYF